MKHLGCVLAAGVLAAAFTGTAAAQEMRMLSSFEQNLVHTREIGKPFIKAIGEKTEGRITFRESGPETVPGFEQLDPVAKGLFHVLYTHYAYHPGTTGVGLAVDAFTSDPQSRRDSGLWEYVDKHYQTLNLKLLSMPPLGTKSFHFVLKAPLKQEKPLAGLKLRGTSAYHPLMEALGAAPIVLQGGEVYTAMERGVIDGAAYSTVGVIDFKWYEVAKYIGHPAFGQTSMIFLMNLDAWNGLDAATQKIFLDVGADLETRTLRRYDELAAQELAQLKEKGMQVTEFPAQDAARLDALWADGVLKIGSAKSPEGVAGMIAVAEKGGLQVQR